MLHEKGHIEISISCRYGVIKLYIDPNGAGKLYEEDSPYIGEPKYHLEEGSSYSYELSLVGADGLSLQFALDKNLADIVYRRNSARHPSEGDLRTGNYVGTLMLPIVVLDTGEEVAKVYLEVRSTKSNYESDYRQMLDEIAEYYTDLILQQGSPVTQQLEIDDTTPATTLYQRFSFIRSFIDSESFTEAIHKIITNPARKWTEATMERSIVGVRRLHCCPK